MVIVDKIRKSSTAKRILSGAFWSMTGTALAKLIVLVAGILCAHVLGKDEYGEFGMVRSTINLFIVFGTAGFGVTLTKFVSEYRKTQKSKISGIYASTNIFVYIIATIVTALTIIFAKDIASITINAPHLTTPIRLGALLLFITTINGVQNGTLAGFEDFKSIALNTLYGSIVESILMLVGGFYYGVSGAILGYGCGFAVIYICNKISINKNFKKHNIIVKYKRPDKEYFNLIFKFTLPLAISSFIVMPTFWIIRTFLVNNNGFGELAIYEAADQWRIIILFIPSAIGRIVLPILSSMSNGNTNSFWKVVNVNIYMNAIISTILALIVILFSESIMGSYGKDYNDTTTLIILALSTIPSSISSIIGSSIVSRSKIWTGLSFNFFWSILMILTSYLFVKAGYGASSIAYATLISYTIHFIFQFIYLKITVKQNI